MNIDPTKNEKELIAFQAKAFQGSSWKRGIGYVYLEGKMNVPTAIENVRAVRNMLNLMSGDRSVYFEKDGSSFHIRVDTRLVTPSFGNEKQEKVIEEMKSRVVAPQDAVEPKQAPSQPIVELSKKAPVESSKEELTTHFTNFIQVYLEIHRKNPKWMITGSRGNFSYVSEFKPNGYPDKTMSIDVSAVIPGYDQLPLVKAQKVLNSLEMPLRSCVNKRPPVMYQKLLETEGFCTILNAFHRNKENYNFSLKVELNNKNDCEILIERLSYNLKNEIIVTKVNFCTLSLEMMVEMGKIMEDIQKTVPEEKKEPEDLPV